MLQELVATDPVLSKVSAKKVTDACQQLLCIAPEILKERELTRAFLRQAIAFHVIDPFQDQQLIHANTQLVKQHQLQQRIKYKNLSATK
jgi:hypothetical protein